MPSASSGQPRSDSAVTPVLAVLGIAALVAVASKGAPVWTELGDGMADRTRVLDGIAELGMVGVVVSAAVTLVVHHLMVTRRPGSPPLRVTLVRAIPITLISLALLMLIALARAGSSPERPGGGAMQMDWFSGLGIASDPNGVPTATAGSSTLPAPPEAENEGSRRRSLLLAILLVVLAIVLATATIWWLRRSYVVRPAPLAIPLQDAQPEPMPEAPRSRERFEAAIEAMLRDTDPRRAIIGAYARLLETVHDDRRARRSWEAPREHLRRVLAEQGLPAGPFATLVDLFEVARYSTHPLREAHREEALRALRSALDLPPTAGSTDASAVPGAGDMVFP